MTLIDRGHQGAARLRQRPVLAADAAGRGLPDAAGDAGASRARCRARPSPPPSPRSRSPPVATTRCRCSPGSGSRSTATTLTLAATDRYRLAVRELPWTPEQSGGEAVALVPARTLADTAKSLAAGDGGVPGARAPERVGEGLHRLRGAAAAATTTRLLDGEFPKYRALLPVRVADAWPAVDTGAFVEAVKRVALVAERNTPVRLTFSAGEVAARRGHRRRRPGDRGARGRRSTGEPITHRVQPAVPPRRSRGHRRPDRGPVVHDVDQAGRPDRPHRCRRPARGRRRATATC